METLLFLGGGVLVGFFLRKKHTLKMPIEQSISIMIWCLLFLLGISIGANQEVINSIHIIGWKAMILTIGGISGSIACSSIVYYKFFK